MKLNPKVTVTAIPIIAVNLAATIAQYQFIRSHLPTWGIAGQLLLALAIESIAIQLSYFAHLAMVAGDSFAKLRISAIVFACFVALANGSHYTANGRITFASVAVGLCSLASPILWGIFSRRQSRDKLLAEGLIEGHAVRLGSARWFYWPGRTLKVFRAAAWSGVVNPAEAITNWEESQEKEDEESARTEIEISNGAHARRITLEAARTKSDAVKVALTELGDTLTARAVADWLRERGWNVTPAHVRAIKAQVNRNGSAVQRSNGADVLALPVTDPIPELGSGNQT